MAKKSNKDESKEDILNEAEENEPNQGEATPKVKHTRGPEQPVYDHLGNIFRVYSEELHGKKYKELAREFVEKNNHKGFSLNKPKQK